MEPRRRHVSRAFQLGMVLAVLIALSAGIGVAKQQLTFVTRTKSITLAPGEGTLQDARCAEGEFATGGGFNVAVGSLRSGDLEISASQPSPAISSLSPTGWEVAANNFGQSLEPITVFVVCAQP